MGVVLFDLDGTLLDTAPDMVASLGQLCEEEDQPVLSYDLARSHVSNGSIGLLKVAFGDPWQEQFPRLQKRFLAIYESRLCEATVLFPGMQELLDALEQASLRWGVVTNKPGYLTEPLLDAMKLRERCAVVVSGDTLAVRKPHPEPLLYALAQVDAAADQSIYVGDAARDIQSGTAAKVATVAATYGYIQPGDNPADWNADYSIDHPGELLQILAKRGMISTDLYHEQP